MDIKIVEISKEFKRVINDGNYGSFSAGTVISATVEVASPEDLIAANEYLATECRNMTTRDLKTNFDLKAKKEVY